MISKLIFKQFYIVEKLVSHDFIMIIEELIGLRYENDRD